MRLIPTLSLALLLLVSGTSVGFAQDTVAPRVTWQPTFLLGPELFPSFIRLFVEVSG